MSRGEGADVAAQDLEEAQHAPGPAPAGARSIAPEREPAQPPPIPAMPWRRLADQDPDRSVPKLANLAQAARAGLRVPTTIWAPASKLEASDKSQPQAAWPDRTDFFPCIIRSASPSEDTQLTSNAGKFLSVVVGQPQEFASALQAVLDSLPSVGGKRSGAVFVQPLIESACAGITFFDGFYFEQTTAQGTNHDLTSGRHRGQVRRGHLVRGDGYLDWLGRVHRVFGGRLDIEWAAAEATGNSDPWLLQVRPALFPIRRCETLSLANHKEVFGDPPSPWLVGVLMELSRPVMSFYERAEPAMKAWHEPYAVELAERAWLNFSALFRLMDHWGLPRAMVTEGLGGESQGPLDHHANLPRLLLKLPALVHMGLACLAQMAAITRGLHRLGQEIDRAESLLDLQQANVRAQTFSIQTNIAIMMALAVCSKLRKGLGLEKAARLITCKMMDRFAELASRPNLDDRMQGLDQWLREYGHRGPLETDVSQPRFAELRDTLRLTLLAGPVTPLLTAPRASRAALVLGRGLFLPDEIREWFRDRLMHHWQGMRQKILVQAEKAVAAGHLETPSDVFYLRRADLQADPASWRQRVSRRRQAWAEAKQLRLPTTATRDAIEAAIAARQPLDKEEQRRRYVGIGLGTERVHGTAVRADELKSLLSGRVLPENPVLIAASLEPSWAVVFPRFAAVVVELGGEMSHAAILLREAGIPSIFNARGAFYGVPEGARVLVDPSAGLVQVEIDPVKAPGRTF